MVSILHIHVLVCINREESSAGTGQCKVLNPTIVTARDW